jgi:tRNA dimethylallyltransferase
MHGDEPPPPPQGYPAPNVWIGLQVEPVVHRDWIAARARAQFANGLLEEAASLRERYGPSPRAFSAFGYHEAFAAIDGTLTIDQAVERDITRTNQFARRQRTWFRAEPDINWLDATSQSPDQARQIIEASLKAPSDT